MLLYEGRGQNNMRIGLFIIFVPALLFGQDFSSEEIFSDSSGRAFVEKLVSLAWENYPQNKVYASRMAIAEENLVQNKWNWLNNLSLSYQYNPTTATSSTTGLVAPRFGIGLSINVGSLVLTPSRVTQAEEELKVANADLKAQKTFIRAEIVRRLANYTRSLDLLKVRTQAKNDSESSLELIQKRFANGEVSLEILNQALRTYTDNEERRVTSTGDLLYHKAALEELIGVPLEGVK